MIIKKPKSTLLAFYLILSLAPAIIRLFSFIEIFDFVKICFAYKLKLALLGYKLKKYNIMI